MSSHTLSPGDEGRHRAGPHPLWCESWSFDFALDDATLGGFARLALYPELGMAWYWASLVGLGRRLLLVRDETVEAPKGQVLDLRGQGLWSSMTCETPFDHWSVGLEAFAVAFDDPAEALHTDRGDLVGVAFDLEWEASTPPAATGDGYLQPCLVTGEILVADETLGFAGHGHRSHRWGVQDWWERPWRAVTGIWPDGGSFASAPPGEPVEIRGGPDPLPVSADVQVRGGPDPLPVSADVQVRGAAVQTSVVAPVPLPLEGPDGRRSTLVLCLCQHRRADSVGGAGWLAVLTLGGERGAAC